jgi:tetratricopeptide (TPR) repeat protein
MPHLSFKGGALPASADAKLTCDNERLDTWKEIAAFFRKDVRTMQLWEKNEGLPVRRQQHRKLGSVYAFRAELQEWWSMRSVAPVGAMLQVREPAGLQDTGHDSPSESTQRRSAVSAQGTDALTLARYACLLGAHAWSGRSRRALRKALGYYQDAIELDPGYANGFAGLANVYISLSYNHLMPTRDAAMKAHRAAQRAMELDRSSVFVRNALINVLTHCAWDWTAAERECRDVLDRGKNDVRTLQLYANLLNALGRHDTAIELAVQSCRTTPDSGVANNQLAMAYFYAGEYERAIPHSVRTIELAPRYTMGYALLGRVHAQRGDWSGARSMFERVAELSQGAPFAKALVAYACAGQGAGDEAAHLIAELERTESDPSYPAYDVSGVYCQLGRTSDALRTIRRAYETRETKVIFMEQDPRFAILRHATQLHSIAGSQLRWTN